MAKESMDRITMPAALSAFRLRSWLGCRKQVLIGHREVRQAERFVKLTLK